MKGNLILQILSLVQLNQLMFHSCKTWILNSLIIGWKIVNPCSGTCAIKRHNSIHLDDFYHHFPNEHEEGCLLSCTCKVLHSIFLSRTGMS